jgi:hypothetical protein
MLRIDQAVLKYGLGGRWKGVLSVDIKPERGVTDGEAGSGGSESELHAWNLVKGWLSRGSHQHSDHGSGYYVRSTAHPVVPGAAMSYDESINALNSLDAVYDVDEA